MTLELINPKELPTPASYTQVITAIGSRLVFVAGRWPTTLTATLSVAAI